MVSIFYLKRKAVTSLLFMLAMLVASNSYAYCGRAFRPGTTTHPMINFGSISVPTGKPNGWVIAERFLDMDDASCAPATETFEARMNGAATADPSIYATNVPGVGVRVTPAYDQGHRQYAPFQTTVSSAGPSNILFPQWRLKVELIKIGPIAAGASLSGVFYEGNVLGASSGFRSTASFSGGTFTPISCSTQDVMVRLPPIGLHAFEREPVAGRTPFHIAIHRASTAALTGIDYEFSTMLPIVDPAHGVITLDGTASAKGIGVQITQNEGAPILFSHRYVMTHFMPGQLEYRIPLVAAYYRIGAVQAGTVNSVMQFTLHYK